LNQSLSLKVSEESFENFCLKEELQATKDKLAALKSDQEGLLVSEASAKEAVNFYRNKCRSVIARGRRSESLDPFEAATSLMSELLKKAVSDDEIIQGFMMALLSRRFKNKTIEFLLSQEVQLRSLFDSIGKKKMKNFKRSLSHGCVCGSLTLLLQLAFVAMK
jgi:hypothetical protein